MKTLIFCGLFLPWLALPTVTGQENPLAKYLSVPGATVTLPVSAAKKPFPVEFALDASLCPFHKAHLTGTDFGK